MKQDQNKDSKNARRPMNSRNAVETAIALAKTAPTKRWVESVYETHDRFGKWIEQRSVLVP